MGTETKSNSYTGNTSTGDIENNSPTVLKNNSTYCPNEHPCNIKQFNNSHITNLNTNTNTTIDNDTYSNTQANDINVHVNVNSSVVNSQSLEATSPLPVPFVPIFIEENDVIEGAKEILKVIRPNWDLSLVEFKKFTDGITNKLVGCFNQHQETATHTVENGCKTENNGFLQNETNNTVAANVSADVHKLPNDAEIGAENEIDIKVSRTKNAPVQYSDNVVLVRVYGNKTDLLIDRKAETQNFLLLHSYGLAPSLYGTFKNGLAYEYVPGVTLNTDSVLCPEIWPLVARRMAEMHRVVRKSNESTNAKLLAPMLWKKTQSFFDLVPEQFSDPEKHKRIKPTFLPISRLREEFDQLYKHLESLDSPLVFSHNDLLLGNVIYTKATETVSFIDYEYADYNFQAFDIGNHFAEMCGVDQVDYTLYPQREFQFEWLRVYLQAYCDHDDIADSDVQRLFVQVNQFALAAHIFWTVWSLIQAEHSKIDFDYVDYAYLRYNEYLARKKEFLSLTLNKTLTTE